METTIRLAYQEIKHAQAKHVKGQAYVSMVVKPVQHLNTQAAQTTTTREMINVCTHTPGLTTAELTEEVVSEAMYTDHLKQCGHKTVRSQEICNDVNVTWNTTSSGEHSQQEVKHILCRAGSDWLAVTD